jgi:Sec-independent protein translocase protein TatA
MLDLSFWEIIVIAVACILFINPEDMPEILRQVGKAFRKFKKTVNEFTSILNIDEDIKHVKPKDKVLGLDGEYHNAYDVKEVFKDHE